MNTKTQREKMLLGQEYIAFDEELTKMRQRSFSATMKFNTSGDKKYIEEIFSKKFENFIINPLFYCDYGENIEIGKNVFINFNCSVLSCAKVTIGDNCYIGPNVQIYTAQHPLEPKKRNKGINMAKPIKIGKDCWLGGGVIVLAGVEIGEGTTIGAGSVVTKNIPKNCTAAGNPCRVIRYLDNKNS